MNTKINMIKNEKYMTFREAEEYWSELNSGSFRHANLNPNKQRGNVCVSNTFTLNKVLSNRIHEICNEKNLAIFTFLSAVVGILVHKYVASDYLLLGIPVYGYKRKEDLKNIVLPMCMKFEKLNNFRDVLRYTQKQITEIYKYQFYNWKKRIQEYACGDLEAPIEIFTYFDILHERELCEEIIAKEKPLITFGFHLNAQQEIEVKVICYDSEDSVLPFALFQMFSTILEQGIKEPQIKIENMENVAREISRDTGIEGKNEIYKYRTILELFSEVVERFPKKIALKYQEKVISYEVLDKKSNQFARYLIEKGIRQNEIVAIMVSSNLEMVITLLGVWKAGASYVPISKQYPNERISYILDDAGVNCIVTESSEKIPSSYCGKVISNSENEWNGYLDSKVEIEISDDEGAYVIYTSGTTGKPKGVFVCHKNMVNSLVWRVREYRYSDNDISLQLFDNVFDGFITSLFTGLLSGSKVILLEDWERKNPFEIANIIHKERVSNMICVPTLYYNILQYAETCVLDSLKVVTLAGERLTSELVLLSENILKNTELVNEYGPTENTVVSTIKRRVRGEDKITIGTPIANVRIDILDQYQKQLPKGIPGEICISGKGVAKGYLNQMQLNKEKFKKDLIKEDFVTYRTGDIGKILPNGEIEFLCRNDEQVKVRGYRIELSEIEKNLLEIDYVEYAFVQIEQEDEIVAYIKLNEKLEDNRRLVENLSKRIPYYMVPNLFYEIEKIPYTINGKVDKNKLKHYSNIMQIHTEFIEAVTDAEKECVELWKELLGVEQVGIGNNFFELHGNSLLAAKFINVVYQRYGIKIPMSEFFENATIQYVCKCIEGVSKINIEQLPKADNKEFYEMSNAQKRIYFTVQTEEVGLAYNMPMAFVVDSMLDYKRIYEVFCILLQRHEILRTSFHVYENRAVQKVHYEIKTIEVKESYHEKYDIAELKQNIKASLTKFDLTKAPLMRVELIQYPTENKSVLLLDLHHIIFDGISADILIHEICSLYKGEVLPKMEYQYKDYSEWSSQCNLEGQKEYWIQQFADVEEFGSVLYDKKDSPSHSYEANSIIEWYEKHYITEMRELCKQNKTTEFIIFLSLVMILLHKYTRLKNVIVGTPVSGRIIKETEQMIGMFVNMLPLKVTIEEQDSFVDVIRKVKNSCINGMENQEYSVENIVNDLGVDRLFDVMFIMESQQEDTSFMGDVGVESLNYESEEAKYNLNISISSEPHKGYQVTFQYRTDLYYQDTIVSMMRHFKYLVNCLVKNPNDKVSQIYFFDDKDKEIMDRNWQVSEFVDTRSIYEIFSSYAEKYSDCTAIYGINRQYSYREFQNYVNQISFYLQKSGIQKRDIVCTYLERSERLLAVIYAINQIGAVYVPIDKNYPKSRVDYIIEDCTPKYILVDKKSMDFSYNQQLVVPEYELGIEFENKEGVKIDPDDIMYIIYTSGTTGHPKGVEIKHKSLVNIILDLQECYPMDERMTYLFKTSHVFDVSMTEVFGWFFQGGRLAILENMGEKDPLAICRCIEKNRITHINFVPSMLNIFLNSLRQEEYQLESLKYIFVAGEKISVETVLKCQNLLPHAEMHNLYGPTEGTVYATRYRIDNVENMKSVPIGKTCKNVKSYVLDENQHLCGVGIPGELALAGICIAKGYRNKAELTEEKFIDLEYEPGGKVYKTGDLVRVLPDGNIEFLGRIDSQVKIRGHRIELNELETVIKGYAEVIDCAVIMKKDRDGNEAIHAYVIGENTIEMGALRRYLKRCLPIYMIPSYISQIEELPVTINGKLDKKSLPDIENKSFGEYIAPSNHKEYILCSAFEQVLKRQPIGIDEDFFELGGNSFDVIKLLMLVSTNLPINMQDIYSYRTVRDIAQSISEEASYNGLEKFLDKNKNLQNKITELVKMKCDVSYELYRKRYEMLTYKSSIQRKNVFLTGVTGFLGIHLLYEFLLKSDSQIYVVVRSTSEEEAKKRLKSVWNSFFEEAVFEEYQKRIVCMKGEVSEKNFQLSEEQYMRLCMNVDLIVNAAANVNHYGEYEKSYVANCTIVERLIQFAKIGKQKEIHHISTISLASGHVEKAARIAYTEEDLDIGQKYKSIYLETKLKAEKMLQEYRKNGGSVSVYRIGNLQANSITGKSQLNLEENAFLSIIRFFASIGIGLKENIEFEFTPVDICAHACYLLITALDVNNQTYHVVNTNKIALNSILDSLKPYEDIVVMESDELISKIKQKDFNIDYNILGLLMLHIGIFDTEKEETVFDVYTEKTEYILDKLGFQWSVVQKNTIDKMIRHLVDDKFLKVGDR